jgi:hypothetical protein
MRTQNPPPLKACRFDSDLGHHSYAFRRCSHLTDALQRAIAQKATSASSRMKFRTSELGVQALYPGMLIPNFSRAGTIDFEKVIYH